MPIERETQFKVTLPASLRQYDIITHPDLPAQFNEKTMREFHRALQAFADELATCLGSFPTQNMQSRRKAQWGMRRSQEVLKWMAQEQRGVSIAETSVHFGISQKRATAILELLVVQKLAEKINGVPLSDGTYSPMKYVAAKNTPLFVRGGGK